MRRRIRQARIEHICHKCDKLINPKDKYMEISGETDFFHWTIRVCLDCKDRRLNYPSDYDEN